MLSCNIQITPLQWPTNQGLGDELSQDKERGDYNKL
jgi:hypothetical protein